MDRLKQLLQEYYENMYKNQVGLKDYRWRIQQRLAEDNPRSYYATEKILNKITLLINLTLTAKTKVLVIGAGTGVEMIALANKGCQVYGIEPDKKALQILKLRPQLQPERVIKAVAEKLPFKNDYFDLVYCWQVLEHVQNVEMAIQEMIRVAKKNGTIFLGCPDYRQIVEPHYKMYLPLFLPKWIVKLMIKLRGRPTEFFDSLQFVTAKKVRNILRRNAVTAMQLIYPYAENELKVRDLRKLMYWIQDFWEIEQDQYWLIKKS